MRAKTKRFWSWLLTAVMMLTMVPVSAYAADGANNYLQPDANYYKFDGTSANNAENADITLTKTAVDKGNGTYEVTLTANAEEKITTKPTEVVFVLDGSGSMNYCTNSDCHHNRGDKCNVTKEDYSQSRWSIATSAIETMKKNLGTENITYHYVLFKDKIGGYRSNAEEVSSFSNYIPKGGTYLKDGVDKGIDAFKNKNANQVLIIVGDGAGTEYPSETEWGNKTEFGKFKETGTVYTVGFTFSATQFDAMATKGCDYTANDANELKVAMETISENIVGLITDPMGEKVDIDRDSVKVEENKPDATVNGSTLNWTDNDGLSGEVKLTYTVNIKPTEKKAGANQEIALNGKAQLNYVYDGKEHSVAFPQPKAKFDAATLDVTYKRDGKEIESLKEHEWLVLKDTNSKFETKIPNVGDAVTVDEETYYVKEVTGNLEGALAATAYTVTVILSAEEPTPPQPEAKKITGFEKELVTAATKVGTMVDTSMITFPNTEGKIVIPADGSVTLLYKLTVTGDNGAAYKITDEGANIVSGYSLTGTIPATGGPAVIYVTKTFTANDISSDVLKNTAMIEAGANTELAKGVTEAIATVGAGTEQVAEPERVIKVHFVIWDGSWDDSVPAEDSKDFVLYSENPEAEYTAPTMIPPEGKVFVKWNSDSSGASFSDMNEAFSYSSMLDYAKFDANNEANITLQAVLEDKQPEGPEDIYVRFWLTEGAKWTDGTPATNYKEFHLWDSTADAELSAPLATDIWSAPDRAFVKWDGNNGWEPLTSNHASLKDGEEFTYRDMLEYAQEENDEYVVNLFAVFKDVEIVKPVEKTKTIKVLYLLEDGSTVAGDKQTYTSKDEEGQMMSDIYEEVIPEGQHFDQWILANDFSEYNPRSILSFAALDDIVGDNYDEDGKAVVVFYAQFADNEDIENRTVVVNFTVDPAKGTIESLDEASYPHSNDTTVTFENIDEFDETQFLIPAIEAKEGYRFIGWRGHGADEIEWDADAETFGVSGLCYFPENSNVGYASVDAVFEPIEQEEARKIVVTFYDCGNCEILTDRCDGGAEVQHGYQYVLTEGEDEAFVVPGVRSDDGYEYRDWVNDLSGKFVPWYADSSNGCLTWDSVKDIAYFDGDTGYINIMAKCVKDGDKPVDPDKDTFTVTFEGGAHGTIDGKSTYKYEDGDQIDTVPDVTKTSSKYRFTGWYCEELDKTFSSDAKVMEVIVKEDLTFVAQWKKKSSSSSSSSSSSDKDKDKDKDTKKDTEKILTDEHFAYIVGYEDGKVRPMAYIRRGEVAVIYFRLLDADYRNKHLTSVNVFPDVKEGDWYNTAVSTLANAGIISGREDGKFHANDPITRAELATIVSKFADLKAGKSNFIDVSGHWAERFINSAATYGWISGYPDSTFRPDRFITRAEVMTLTNNVLERAVQKDGMHKDMRTWIDNVEGQWYYETVQEATNSHDYTRNGKDVPNLDFEYETWDDINRDPDWSSFTH